MNESKLIKIFQSRGFAVIITVIASLAIIAAGFFKDYNNEVINNGLLFNEDNNWVENPLCSLFLNIIVLCLISLFFVRINHNFKIIKASTWYMMPLFMVMEFSNLQIATTFNGGTLLALIVAITTFIIFSIYDRSYETKIIFLVFFILTAASLWEISIAYFLAIYIIGIAEMKALNLRSLFAIFLGIVTPFWIVFGFGVRGFSDFFIPEADFLPTLSELVSNPVVYVNLLLTLFLGLIFLTVNLVSAFNYNASRRAFNGFLSLLMIATIILTLINQPFWTYITLLNILVSFSAAHFFDSRNHKKPYIMILLIVIYAAIGVWNFVN